MRWHLWRWLRSAIFVFGLALVLALVITWSNATKETSATTPQTDCGRGIPAVKCNASLYSPPPGAGGPHAPLQPPFPSTAPDTQACGTDFFDSTTAAQLSDRFGLLSCFRFVGGTVWIVVGDGMSVSAPDAEASLGGAIVAVDRCATTDAACLDPNAVHDFGTFTVSYPPLPMSGRSDLEATFGHRLLWVYNGDCGLFTVDTQTLA